MLKSGSYVCETVDPCFSSDEKKSQKFKSQLVGKEIMRLGMGAGSP